MSNLDKTNHQLPPAHFDVNNIFSAETDIAAQSLALFQYQYANNALYGKWCNALGIDPANVKKLSDIAFMPISFFKSHPVQTGDFTAQEIFTSSGTTQTINSRHLVKDLCLYEKSFITAFEQFYGNIANWCIIGLLPSYLERNGSSLIYMVNTLIKKSGHALSGFYLNEFENLAATLQQLTTMQQPTLLIGVTFALLDFAAAFPAPLPHVTIMETGGMKGRRKELTRQEVHSLLQAAFEVKSIHSEYGMTELLSQAYSAGNGRFICPPWMKVMIREEDDPLTVSESGKGILNIIDLANTHSCAFIATDDAGIVHEDGSFEVWGRVDNSDIRGCSLLVL